MTSEPSVIPFFGCNGIDYLASRIPTWKETLGERKAALNLAQIIRMLEEIGTGGAGFRFMYGAYLQLAAQITGENQFKEFSERITAIGDDWRTFASDAASIFKRRKDACTYDHVAAQIAAIGKQERAFYNDLVKVAKAVK